MRREIAIVALFVAACAQMRGIDEHTAIGIGMKACVNAWGKTNPIDVRLANPGFWRARAMGAHWEVWFGSENYDDAFLSALVSKDDGKTTDCALAIH
jgi:hypothetical protein